MRPIAAFAALLTAGTLAGCGAAGVGSGVARQAAAQTWSRSSPTALPEGNCEGVEGGPGILPDGDFSLAPDPGSEQGLHKGDVFAPDWVVTGPRTVDFYSGSTSHWVQPDGLCNVDLDGTPGPGGILHDPFRTKLHARYTVTFTYSGNNECPPAIKHMLVSIERVQKPYAWSTLNGNGTLDGHWLQTSFQFTAFHHLATLQFQSKDPVGHCGAVVAGISITAAP
jgi:hypothetical protein